MNFVGVGELCPGGKRNNWSTCFPSLRFSLVLPSHCVHFYMGFNSTPTDSVCLFWELRKGWKYYNTIGEYVPTRLVGSCVYINPVHHCRWVADCVWSFSVHLGQKTNKQQEQKHQQHLTFQRLKTDISFLRGVLEVCQAIQVFWTICTRITPNICKQSELNIQESLLETSAVGDKSNWLQYLQFTRSDNLYSTLWFITSFFSMFLA